MSTSFFPDRFVLDGSVTLAWLFHDEADPYADAVVAKLPALEMMVPRLWHLEISNVLLVGERRGRCSQADTTTWLSFLSALPIVLDGATETRAWTATLNLARQHGLPPTTPPTLSWRSGRASRSPRSTERSEPQPRRLVSGCTSRDTAAGRTAARPHTPRHVGRLRCVSFPNSCPLLTLKVERCGYRRC